MDASRRRCAQPTLLIPLAGAARSVPSCRELRRAIGLDELTLHYQPVVDLSSGLPVGVEALVRWPHPARGLLGASSFVPMAEVCGLARALDEWVLAHACRQLAFWQEDVLVGPGFRLAVNLSAAQLDSDWLPDRLADIIDFTGVAPENLTIELTETATLSDVDGARRATQGLHDLGVELALDDFGSAYSTFSRLRSLEFDVLKLDGELVRSADEVAGEAFVRAIVELGMQLGSSVVAEGIETEQQAVNLRRLGCNRGQGHLWSPAVSPEEIERLLVTGEWPDPGRRCAPSGTEV